MMDLIVILSINYTKHNITQHNDTDHNGLNCDTQHNDTDHNGLNCDTQHKYYALNLNMPSVPSQNVMPNAVILNTVMLSIVAPIFEVPEKSCLQLSLLVIHYLLYQKRQRQRQRCFKH